MAVFRCFLEFRCAFGFRAVGFLRVEGFTQGCRVGGCSGAFFTVSYWGLSAFRSEGLGSRRVDGGYVGLWADWVHGVYNIYEG